jgi:peptidoglycan/LPS O-acetylase OafA/YrhL
MDIPHYIPYQKPRLKTLDGLRGFAALSVVLCHITAGVFHSRVIEFSPLNILTNAHAAVIFFFVLSGYVLSYQYGNNPNYNYSGFLLLRFVRLYIPYIASIALALALKLMCTQSKSDFWLSTYWADPILFRDVLNHILFIGNFKTSAFNGVIWSLVHEMRLALLFPVLLFITRSKINVTIIISLGIYLAAVCLDISGFNQSAGYLNSYVYTFIYLYSFTCGALIARWQKVIKKWYADLNKPQRWLFIVAGVCLYSYAALLPRLVVKLGLSQAVIDFVYMYIVDILVTIAAIIFIVAAISARPLSLFTAKAIQFLGLISNSLYLVHIPVSAFIVFRFAHQIAPLTVVLLALASSFFVAIAFNVLVERPAMRLGKKSLLA